MKSLKQIFRPLQNCLVLATNQHPFIEENKRVGLVIKVDENIVAYKDFSDGVVHYLIWKFKDQEVNNYYKFIL